MIEKYREVFLSRFKHEPGCQLYEVNVIDQYLYRTLLGNVIKTNMANEIEDDPKRQRQTLCYLGPDAEAFKDKLGVSSSRYCHSLSRVSIHRACAASPSPVFLALCVLNSLPSVVRIEVFRIRSSRYAISQIFNAVIGYGFLVDKKGRIRWQVHGDIDEGEVNTLARCVSELLSSSR